MRTQKRLAASLLKCSTNKIRFDQSRLEDIKKAITRNDILRLINQKAINYAAENSQSRGPARKIARQKKKGRQVGHGSRKGTANARLPGKTEWIKKVRLQRRFIRHLKDRELLNIANYAALYSKIKGGFFRNLRHLKLHLEEYKLIERKEK